MPSPRFYRYFLGVRPDPQLHPTFQALAQATGQSMPLTRLHLTFCVIGELAERDGFLSRRVRCALGGQCLYSFPINLSRIASGSHGAFARTSGRQDEIQDFYRVLVSLLRGCGIEPMHRKSGLHPHVTLGHRACSPGLLPIALSWSPTELLLIESVVGFTCHNVLDRWPLLPPRQPPLPFAEGLIAAAGPARRSAA